LARNTGSPNARAQKIASLEKAIEYKKGDI